MKHRRHRGLKPLVGVADRHLHPYEPRATGPRRNGTQKAPSSLGPMFQPQDL